MTIKNTLLTALAILAICNTGYAVAYDPRTEHDMLPSVEVNLSVLDKLRNSEPMPAGSPMAPEHNFINEKPAKYAASKSETGKHAHKKHKLTHKHKAKKKEAIAEKQKVDTAPEIRVRAADEENLPVVVDIPKSGSAVPKPSKDEKPVAFGNAVALPPLPSEPESSKLPALPPLPSESHKASVPPSLPEKKPEFIMAPTGQITPIAPPLAAHNAPAPVAPKLPALPPLPSESDMMSAPTTKEALPEIPLPAGNAAPKDNSAALPIVPPLPSVSVPQASAPSALPPVPPLPGAGTAPAPEAADNGPPPDLRVVFNEAETDIPMGMSPKLDAIAAQLAKNPGLRISIMAFASGSDAVSIYPKRVSLARGIAVRNYFVSSKSIDVERITVKALGNKNEGGPANRVDLFIIK